MCRFRLSTLLILVAATALVLALNCPAKSSLETVERELPWWAFGIADLTRGSGNISSTYTEHIVTVRRGWPMTFQEYSRDDAVIESGRIIRHTLKHGPSTWDTLFAIPLVINIAAIMAPTALLLVSSSFVERRKTCREAAARPPSV